MNLVPYKYNGVEINDTTNYRAKILNRPLMTPADARWIDNTDGQYPTLAGKRMKGGQLEINITCMATKNSQFEALKVLFSTQNTTPRKFLCKDVDDPDRQWYVMGYAAEINEPNDRQIRITFLLESPIWLTEAVTTEADWDVTSDPGSTTVTPPYGTLPAHPVIELTPLGTRANGHKYRYFVTTYPYTNTQVDGYPVYVTLNTAAEISAGRMTISGDDLYVFIGVGGSLVAVPRWFSGTPVSDTANKIWFRMDYNGRRFSTLLTTVDANDTDFVVSYIENEALIATDGGSFLIESERCTYTSYSVATHTFSGVTRGQFDSSAAAHNAGNFVIIIDEVWIMHGSGTGQNYTNSALKPIFDLDTSTMSSWVYSNFYNPTLEGSSQWIPHSTGVGAWYYTATKKPGRATVTFPAAYMGNRTFGINTLTGWAASFPFGFTNVTLTSIERRQIASIYSGAGSIGVLSATDPEAGVYEFAFVTANTVAKTWEAQASLSITPSVSCFNTDWYIHQIVDVTGTTAASECASATVTLDTSTTSTRLGVPYIACTARATTEYPINATITNATTGESITIDEIITGSNYLQIDTLNKTVSMMPAGRDRFSAISWNTIRTEWLELTAGVANLLTYTESAPNITVVIKYQGRNS